MKSKLNPVQTYLDQVMVEDFTSCIDDLVGFCEAPFNKIAGVISAKDCVELGFVDVFWNPCLKKYAVLRPSDQPKNEIVKLASERLRQDFGDSVADPITPKDRTQWWVKVSHSSLIRSLGEALQFLPSDTVPGFGGRPIASTIATGILGGGLGYLGGSLFDRYSGDRFDKDNKKRWAAMGALGGGLLGATPGFLNLAAGKNFNDLNIFRGNLSDGWQGGKSASAFSSLSPNHYPLIRKDNLGAVVWGTDPQLAAMTIGVVQGADRMPGGVSPGVVTPHQTGLLGVATSAVGGGLKGYIAGYTAGKVLGALTGLDDRTQKRVQQTGIAAGVLNATIPRLFSW